MPIISNIPFDSAPNATVTPDFGPGQTPATVHGATFGPGHNGYAAQFTGTDYIRAKNPPLDLTGPFTIMFWRKAEQIAPYSAPLSLKFQFAFSDNSIIEFSQLLTLNTWQHWAIVRSGTSVTFYLNGSQIGTRTFTAGHPVEWAVKQTVAAPATLTATLTMTFGGNEPPYAQGMTDSLLIFNEALDVTTITGYANPQRKVLYWVDDIPFLDYQVYVSASKGVIDGLKMKSPQTVDWAHDHGLIIDLERPRFEPREIELECFMPAGSNLEFAMKVDTFLSLFVGMHRLKIEIDPYKPLVYQVYIPDGTSVRKQWRQADLIGTFTLKLTDPQPVKRVLRFNQPAVAPSWGVLSPFPANFKGVYINFESDFPVNIYWGDGTVSKDVLHETPQAITHTYPTDERDYEILICCEPDLLDSFITNANVLWNKL